MNRFAVSLLLFASIAFAVFATMSVVRADAPKPAPGEAVNFPPGSPEPPPSKELFEAGKRTFGNRCARCHGWNMVNLGSIAFDLRKFPHEDRVRFMTSVHNGKNAMPAWKGVLSEDEIEGVWAYVRMGGQM